MYTLRLMAKKLLGQTRRKLLGPHAEAVLYRMGDHRFLVDSGDFTIGRKLAFTGDYQPEEMEYLLALIERFGIRRLLIVGSHVGIFAVRLAPALDRVWAIEANPNTFRLLAWNIAINRADNVELLPFAATEKETTLTFWPSIENTGGSKVAVKDASFAVRNDAGAAIEIAGKPIDTLGFDPQMVLMDVEGHEVFALRGMAQTLRGVRVLACELIPGLLEQNGLSLEDQLSILRDNFDRFWLDSFDGPGVTAAEVEAVFRDLSGDDKDRSRNIICVKQDTEV